MVNTYHPGKNQKSAGDCFWLADGQGGPRQHLGRFMARTSEAAAARAQCVHQLRGGTLTVETRLAFITLVHRYGVDTRGGIRLLSKE